MHRHQCKLSHPTLRSPLEDAREENRVSVIGKKSNERMDEGPTTTVTSKQWCLGHISGFWSFLTGRKSFCSDLVASLFDIKVGIKRERKDSWGSLVNQKSYSLLWGLSFCIHKMRRPY